MIDLSGKVAVIPGAGRGIGRAIAMGLAARGMSTVVADLPNTDGPHPAEQVAAEIAATGARASAVNADISTMAGANACVDAALRNHGRIDAMICVAGLFDQAPIWEIDEAHWDRMIGANLRGPFCCTKAALEPMMAQKSGRILYFSSAAALMGLGHHAAYGAAKAGVLALGRLNAIALEPHGIMVNTILPGASTRMTDAVYRYMGADVDTLAADTPLADDRRAQTGGALSAGVGLRSDQAAGTWRDPANLTPFIAYLMSNRAAGISGQAFALVGHQVTHIRERPYGGTIRSEGRWDDAALAEAMDRDIRADCKLHHYDWPPA